MHNYPTDFVRTVIKASTNNVYVTINQLSDLLGLDTEKISKLDIMQEVLVALDDFDLELLPKVKHEENFDTQRLLYQKDSDIDSNPSSLQWFQDHESEEKEFKSSLSFDYKKYENTSGINLSECHSDDLVQASLKTICAFINTDGGDLFVGVDDDGKILGIERDLSRFKPGKQNTDNWQLRLRDLIKTNFKDGDTINNYVKIQFIHMNDGNVAHVKVSKRQRLAFLKSTSGNYYYPYIRQGNRTIVLNNWYIQEYIENRKHEFESNANH